MTAVGLFATVVRARKRRIALLFAIVALGGGGCGGDGNRAAEERAELSRAYGLLPLSFEANRGQHDRDVEFAARIAGGSVSLTRREAVLSLRDQQLRMQLEGASPTLAGERQLPGKANYLQGNDRADWITDVPTYGRVRYRDAWPGIDVTFRGEPGRGLEYDFELAPGADPDRIRLTLAGHRGARIDGSGELVMGLDDGEVRARRPVTFQRGPGGTRTPVESRHLMRADGSLGFQVGAYDASRPLVIDPLLVYSTYLGGSGNDKARAVAVDVNGNAYVTGETESTNFPKLGALQGSVGGGSDAFITKIDSDGALVYSTYVGGIGFDEGKGIAVDFVGRAYVTGRTQSSNFPAELPGDTTLGGDQDAFVLRLNAAGNDTLFSTLHGGSDAGDFDDGWAIAVGPGDSAFVAGDTDSGSFPTVSPRQTNQPGDDGFVSKFSSSGTLVYSTYHGAAGADTARAIAVDDLGNAYVTGFTFSSSFPLANPLQTDATGSGEAFVSKFNPAGDTLLYSTYLGGDDTDQGHGIAVDASRNAYVTGWTRSEDFPKTGDAPTGVFADAFVVKLAPAGNALVYATFVGGGNSSDEARAIAVDANGRAHITGWTTSHDFPLVTAFDTELTGVFADAFVAKLDGNGAVRYATYLGETGNDEGNGIGVDAAGSAYVVGETDSDDFPTAAPLQGQRAGDIDGFVTRIDGSDETAPDTTIDAGPPGRTQDRAATFSFSASEPAGATFECSLDDGVFKACTSPAAVGDLGDGQHSFRVRATDASRNLDDSPASFSWRVDLTPPVARLTVSPNTIKAGEAATFDASASSDDAGRIVRFQFDLDGDGAFETDALDQPRSSRAYTVAGNIGASVRVTDEVGLTSTSRADLRVNPGPTPPPQLTRASLDISFATFPRRFTRVRRFRILMAKPGMTVSVSCKGKGKGCPRKTLRKTKTIKITKTGRHNLLSLVKNAKLRTGVKLEVRILEPGVVGKFSRYTIRRSAGPKRVTRCVVNGRTTSEVCPV